MKRRNVVVAAGVLGLYAVVACSDEGDTIAQGVGVPMLKFQPSCGSPGDKVLLTLQEEGLQAKQGREVFCKTPERYAVKFAPNASGQVVGSRLGAQFFLCEVEAVVPADARTGTIQLEMTNEPDVAQRAKYESREIFQIPCPGDAAADADAGDAGSGEETPIAALYNLLRTTATGRFTAYLVGETTPAQQADVAATVADDLSRLTAPGVALGSCGTPTAPPPPATPVPGVSAGVVTLSNGGTPLATASPQTSNGDTFYEAIINGAPADTVLDVSLQGTREFPATTVPGAVRSAPDLTVTSPNLSGGQVLAPAGDLTIDFTPTQATHMAITVQSLGGGAPKVCKVDPSAGTFTIPGSVMGAAGTTTSVNVRLGYVVEKVVGGKRHVSISDSSINGIVSLQ